MRELGAMNMSDWNTPAPGLPGGNYGQYGPPAINSGRAMAILVLGIVSLVLVCGYGIGVIPAVVALALSPGAKREIANSGGRITGTSFVTAGVICSWITVGISAVAVGVGLIILLVSAVQGS